VSEEKRVWQFTVSFDDSGSVSKVTEPSSKVASLERSTSSFDDIPAPPRSQLGPSLSDDDILRGIRFVETSAGRRSGGTIGGYSEMRSDTGVYGAYQIKKNVWQDKIKAKLGLDFEDWFNPDAKAETGIVQRTNQDRIAREILLPEHKRQVASARSYDTPLGKHLPSGSLEILAQLGVGNLQTFLNTGVDRTAFPGMPQGQILNYLSTAMKLFDKKVPDSFYKQLEKTKNR